MRSWHLTRPYGTRSNSTIRNVDSLINAEHASHKIAKNQDQCGSLYLSTLLYIWRMDNKPKFIPWSVESSLSTEKKKNQSNIIQPITTDRWQRTSPMHTQEVCHQTATTQARPQGIRRRIASLIYLTRLALTVNAKPLLQHPCQWKKTSSMKEPKFTD